MINIRDISDFLHESEIPGFWISTGSEEISYPDRGHEQISEFEHDSFWFRHRLKCLVRMIRRYPSPMILDIGGGNGRISIEFTRSGIPSVLLEPGHTGAMNGFNNGLKPVINSSLSNSRIYENSIPSAGIFDVLEHIRDDTAFLNEIFRILVPGGRMYITVPAYPGFWSDFDVRAGHIRRYRLDDLARKVKAAGFEVEYASYFFYLLPFPLFIMRKLFYPMIKRIAWSSRKAEHLNNIKFFRFVILFLLTPDHFMISNGIRFPFGTSCMIVAKKPSLNG